LRHNQALAGGGVVVKKKRFTVEHIAGILKQAELGTSIAELCRQHGVSEQSFYRWKKLYGNMEPSEVRELRQLRDENAKLKRIVADLSLGRVMLQDVLQKKFGRECTAKAANNGVAAVLVDAATNAMARGQSRC
jgi:putative transposase